MKAKENILHCDYEKLISKLLFFLIFVLWIYIACMIPSSSQSSQFELNLNSSLIQNCDSCNCASKELKIMSLRGEQYTNQVKDIQNILKDLGFSLQEVEDWQEQCIPGKCIETILVPGARPKDLTAGGGQDSVWISIFPNESLLNLYIEKGYPYGYMLDFESGYFGIEHFDLGDGSKAIGAARRWSAYNEAEIQGEYYPTGVAQVRFYCGNLYVKVGHTKVLAHPWKNYPEDSEKDQETMGNESLKPAKELAQKIALALHAKKLCQLKPDIILKASATGYTSAKKELENARNLKEIKIFGKVLDNSIGKPIEGAKVEIVSGANNTSIATSADGTYSIVAAKVEGQGSETREKIDFELRPLQYIVGVTDITPDVTDLIKKNNGTVVDQVNYDKGPKALLVSLNDESDEQSFVSNLNGSSLVKYVEPNMIIYASYVPNDPLYPKQWGPKNIRAGGLPNPSAWDVEKGDKNITIAIVDTGIQYDHEDLYNFKDGSTKYLYGHDWVDDDEDPSPVGFEGHGTHCAGVATAVMDNSKGIAGIAPNCTFIAERTHNYWGRGYDWDVSRGIIDAAEHKADIISMSFGSNISSLFERDATLYASSLGSILVAAAGNDANDEGYDGGINYPAAYQWVIGVGAIDSKNQRADFSQWGKELAVVAPGVDVISTAPWNDYESKNGTSMATPHVAGVAALVKSRAMRWPAEPYATNPRYHLNNDQISKVLIQSAVDLGPPGWDQEYGYGKVDAGRAVRCVNISGNVLEDVFNAPITAVEVRATSIEGPPGIFSTKENSSLARISSDGEYFIRVPPGIYHICAMAHGYIPSCGMDGDRVELPAFDINGNLYKDNRDFRLVPFGFNLTGWVLDVSTGQPVSQAGIFLDGPQSMLPPNSPIAYQTETNSTGYYGILLEYGVDPYGLYNIAVIKQGYKDQNKSINLDWDDVITDYYTCRNCRLDFRDYNPISVNFTLAKGQSSSGISGLPKREQPFNGSDAQGAEEQSDADRYIKALKDPNSTIRLNAAEALGKIKDLRAVDPLIAALRDENYDVRDAAAIALGNLRDTRAVEPLIAALKDEKYIVRQAAEIALGNISDARATEPLIQALNDEQVNVRSNAAWALGHVNDLRAVEPLIQALTDSESVVRMNAAGALGRLRDIRAVEPLLKALRDNESMVRAYAAGALGKIKDTRAIDALNQALKDSSPYVREVAADALGSIYVNPSGKDIDGQV